jgi:methylthioribose-1-phosphate isomerase
LTLPDTTRISSAASTGDCVRAVEWSDAALKLLDQRLLPGEERYLALHDAPAVANAIRDMVVRGAPAIGIAAAYGVVLAVRAGVVRHGAQWRSLIEPDLALLSSARPTAVNLAWAVERMRRAVAAAPDSDPESLLLAEARAIHDEDIAANRRMGELGAALIASGSGVLTHCNTGSLATGGFGTALGVIRAAHGAGRIRDIYADETRPWLQGARLTAWELMRDGIPVTLIADSAASLLMQRGRVQWVIVGADRIAANGDTANKIGTYQLAVSARHHGVKFMVVAPTSTIDFATETGAGIAIEERSGVEVTKFGACRAAPPDVQAWNPAFDVTPATLIDAIVTEKGVVPRPDPKNLAALR